MPFYRIQPLRRVVLPLLRWAGTDISINHHWTNAEFKLHLFKHKGYWYHGRRRELETMQLFADLVSPGDFVIEIGGHIGYISVYLASLVGREGSVWVFEPARANLSYLRQNVAPYSNVSVYDLAVSNRRGHADFYVEELTGQNNSLLPDYSVLRENEAEAHLTFGKEVVQVPCVTLDETLKESAARVPSFVKIDVEGAEYMVLQGMKSVLTGPSTAMMIEVTERAEDVLEHLRSFGFLAFDVHRNPIDKDETAHGNVFFIKECDRRLAHFLGAK